MTPVTTAAAKACKSNGDFGGISAKCSSFGSKGCGNIEGTSDS